MGLVPESRERDAVEHRRGLHDGRDVGVSSGTGVYEGCPVSLAFTRVELGSNLDVNGVYAWAESDKARG